tara:strand:- start:40 stop:384 length:345 start_codon:yes stop_codon:yes gene_type:complete
LKNHFRDKQIDYLKRGENMMSQYKDKVELQRKILAAEKYSDSIKGMQVHSMSSMWYDNRPQDTEKHSVTDIEYMSGKIERTLHDGTKVVLVEAETGAKLVDKIEAQLTDRGETL